MAYSALEGLVAGLEAGDVREIRRIAKEKDRLAIDAAKLQATQQQNIRENMGNAVSAWGADSPNAAQAPGGQPGQSSQPPQQQAQPIPVPGQQQAMHPDLAKATQMNQQGDAMIRQAQQLAQQMPIPVPGQPLTPQSAQAQQMAQQGYGLKQQSQQLFQQHQQSQAKAQQPVQGITPYATVQGGQQISPQPIAPPPVKSQYGLDKHDPQNQHLSLQELIHYAKQSNPNLTGAALADMITSPQAMALVNESDKMQLVQAKSEIDMLKIANQQQYQQGMLGVRQQNADTSQSKAADQSRHWDNLDMRGTRKLDDEEEKIRQAYTRIGQTDKRIALAKQRQDPLFKANSVALTGVEKDISKIRPFLGMIDRNMEVVKELGNKLSLMDSKFANKTVNQLSQEFTNNPELSEYIAQVRIAVTESAKAINNPNLTGPLTDTARKEIETIADSNMPFESLVQVLQRFRMDGANRIEELNKERDKRLDGPLGKSGADIPAEELKPGQILDGHMYNGGDPSNKNNWSPIGNRKI